MTGMAKTLAEPTSRTPTTMGRRAATSKSSAMLSMPESRPVTTTVWLVDSRASTVKSSSGLEEDDTANRALLARRDELAGLYALLGRLKRSVLESRQRPEGPE